MKRKPKMQGYLVLWCPIQDQFYGTIDQMKVVSAFSHSGTYKSATQFMNQERDRLIKEYGTGKLQLIKSGNWK